jgi:hypothetical protein
METTSDDRAQYRLLVLGDGSVRTIALRGSRWVVGRANDCDVPLRDPTVSNPVMLEGRPTKEGSVEVGATLAIGLTRLVIERRPMPAQLSTTTNPTVVISREVAEDDDTDDQPGSGSFAATAASVLDRIEWTFADLGDLNHAAEPLLDLALNLSGRRLGWIGRFDSSGQPETLASLDCTGKDRSVIVPEPVLTDARRIARPHVLTTQEDGVAKDRLLIPLGRTADGMLVLEDPGQAAPSGQELLRLAHSLSLVVWHRLQETTERVRLRDELQRLRFRGTSAHNALLASSRLQDVRLALRSHAAESKRVLLAGEAGTELEDLARYLHAESARRGASFVAWDAARVPASRHEVELFGGAQRVGQAQLAAGGTLFVDHFELLAPPLQARLATLPPGGAPDGRVPPTLVAATRAPIGELPDLATNPWTERERITVPPLRGHPRDVQTLAELFLSELGTCPTTGAPRLLSERAKRLLVTYTWPGNVRELRLVLEEATREAGDEPIAPRHLPPSITTDAGPTQQIATLDEVERVHIVEVMARTGGNRSRAAQLLGIATSTLYEKLKRYRIEG